MTLEIKRSGFYLTSVKFWSSDAAWILYFLPSPAALFAPDTWTIAAEVFGDKRVGYNRSFCEARAEKERHG